MTARLNLLIGLCALFLAGPALAADDVRAVPVKKLFPYLEAYLSLPAQERDRFALRYRFLAQAGSLSALRIFVGSGAQRAPLALDPDGYVARLPNLALLRSDAKAEIGAPPGLKLKLELDVVPLVAPAAEMDARALAAAASQATAGAKKAAGVMGFAAPRLDRVVFKGAAGGRVLLASGRSAPLPVVAGEPVFDPARYPGARELRFSRAPSRLVLAKAS